MDGTPHLLTDVKFSERRKGYDPAEVDNFLERVSAAVAQLQDKLRDATTTAEEADARINEAKRAQAVAEAQVDQLKADLGRVKTEGPGAGEAPTADDAEQASALLVMAQKTADAAIDESRRKADATLAEARAKATTLVGDAEAEADRIRSDARRIADELVEQKRTAAIEEVAALESLKGQIQFDVDLLQRHVDEERAGLRSALDRLGELLDDPGAFHISAAPAVSSASSADVVEREDAEAGDEVATEDEVFEVADVEVVEEAEPSGDEPEATIEDLEVEEAIVVDEAPSDGDPSDEAGEPGDADIVEDAVELVTRVEASVSELDPMSERLFAPQSELDLESGPATEAFQPFPAEAPSGEGLGAPDEHDDEAMRAFFETDFDTVEAEKKSRWRR